ncbi:MAG: MarR family transcriptional regulator [Phycisphaera sp.]|nr:MarR family transcriptional regulator [Phycisphaera sp.]
MIPVVLNLSCPKLRAALPDIALMQRWEVLRRSAEPMTAHELAEACGVSDGVAQRSLDTLVDVGLVVRLKANARRRGIAYRSIAELVIIEWDSDSDADLAVLLRNRQATRALSRSIIDRNDTTDTRGMPGLAKFRGHQSFMLTRAESEAIAQALRNAWQTITRIEADARKRGAARIQGGAASSHGAAASSHGAAASSHGAAASSHGAAASSHGAAASGNGGAATSPDPAAAETVPFHIALEFRPLREPELPICDLGTWEKKALARELAFLTRVPEAVLAPREREIAQRLAAGESRPQVAQALGVSVNTIASATKRIYAKLGVRSRAEFATRMKEHA